MTQRPHAMIARIWRGAVRSANADRYAAYMAETGVPGYARTPGNLGVYMLRRALGERCEFVMVTFWESLDAVRAFAGDDHEEAVFYPEDDRFLVERDERASHFEVASAEPGRGALDLRPIGSVQSPLTDPAKAPKQGDEGAPEAWLVFEPGVVDALDGVEAGDEVVVLTWLDRARRDVLRVHPRGDPERPQRGVFSTRSPHRPNPIGLHTVEVTAVERGRLRVRNLEAVHGTPIVDVKPLLPSDVDER